MRTHYRNYGIYVNGFPLNRIVSIEAISTEYINKIMQHHKKEVIKNNKATDKDTITFRFKYCNS